jgi:hypothetical protein
MLRVYTLDVVISQVLLPSVYALEEVHVLFVT